MRDDTTKWDAPVQSAEICRTGSLTATCIRPVRQTLVSGPNVLNQSTLPLVSWPDQAEGAYALVLRRDRILEVNGPARIDGWDDDLECAVSDMSDGYSLLQLEGPGAPDLLQQGGFADIQHPSRSVSRLLFGLPALLCRLTGADRYAIHVPRGHEQALRNMITSHAAMP